jgi:hypothetical protein
MRKTVLVLSLLLAASTVAKADGEEHAKHHARHHVAVAAAKACDPYDVKWHVLGSLGTFVVASALMPWALHDLDDSVAREKGCKFY